MISANTCRNIGFVLFMISVQHCSQTDNKNNLYEFCDGNQLKTHDYLLLKYR